MTIQGAIAELQNLLEADDVPFYYKGGIEKVIETIQMEMADRKDEPNSSEKPNNCEKTDCDTCRYAGECDWEPWQECPYEPKTEPTISKMEQVDKDINVRSKDEPQTDCAWR